MLIVQVEKRVHQSPRRSVYHGKAKEKVKPKDRFSDLTSDEALAKILKGYVPPNTEKNTAWSTRMFEQWQEVRKTLRLYNVLSLASAVCNRSEEGR